MLAVARERPEVVCSVHQGMVEGALEAAGGDARGVRLEAFADLQAGDLGAFPPRAEALRAAGCYDAYVGEEYRYVLIREEHGEWEEAVVEIERLH